MGVVSIFRVDILEKKKIFNQEELYSQEQNTEQKIKQKNPKYTKSYLNSTLAAPIDNVLREKIYFLKDLIKTVKDISTEVAYLIFY